MDIKEVQDKLIEELKKYGIKIQLYHAMSTNSVYLKLDYGVLNTIRISDHKGKKNMSYKYNVLTNLTTTRLMRYNSSTGTLRFFCSPSNLNDLVTQVLKDRQFRYEKMGGVSNYMEQMEKNYEQYEGTSGFWSSYEVM